MSEEMQNLLERHRAYIRAADSDSYDDEHLAAANLIDALIESLPDDERRALEAQRQEMWS